MSKPADVELLGQGHALLAQWCVDLLSGKIRDEDDKPLRPTAAELSVIRAFFKDNNITCPPGRGNAVEKLKEQLESRQKRRSIAPFNPETDLGDGGSFGKMQ